MIVLIIEHKGFKLLCEDEAGKYLNKGDIFIPDGHGWEYIVIRKVMLMVENAYQINVLVKKA